MTTEITLEQMDAALQKAIDARGADYVYPKGVSCIYVNREDEPMCGVGYAVVELGLLEPMKDAILRWQEAHGTRTSEGELMLAGFEGIDQPAAVELFDYMEDVTVDPDAARLANAFQVHQDGRYDWGRSLTIARNKVAAS